MVPSDVAFVVAVPVAAHGASGAAAAEAEEAVAATRAMTSANNVRGLRISKAVAPEWRLVGSDARKRITSR